MALATKRTPTKFFPEIHFKPALYHAVHFMTTEVEIRDNCHTLRKESLKKNRILRKINMKYRGNKNYVVADLQVQKKRENHDVIFIK